MMVAARADEPASPVCKADAGPSIPVLRKGWVLAGISVRARATRVTRCEW